MRMHRWIQRSIPLAATALLGAAPVMSAQYGVVAPAQGQQLFEWSGPVDREVQIVMHGNRLSTNNIGRTETGNYRNRTFSVLPRQDGQVVVEVLNGRGNVDVIQQPNAQNGYSTVVRIQDPRSGSDMYRLRAYFQGYSNGDVYGNTRGDVYGNGRGNGRADERSHGQRGEEMKSRGRDNDGDDRNSRANSGQVGQVARQSLLHWSGNVDDELEIRIQNGRVEYRTVHGAQPTSIRVNAGNVSIPRANTQIGVLQNQGRGSVTVIQQPSQWNGNTTVIRVRDPQGGYGYYDFDLIWQ